jgi:hypothetical protein
MGYELTTKLKRKNSTGCEQKVFQQLRLSCCSVILANSNGAASGQPRRRLEMTDTSSSVVALLVIIDGFDTHTRHSFTLIITCWMCRNFQFCPHIIFSAVFLDQLDLRLGSPFGSPETSDLRDFSIIFESFFRIFSEFFLSPESAV